MSNVLTINSHSKLVRILWELFINSLICIVIIIIWLPRYLQHCIPTWKTRLTLSERDAPQGESTGVCLVKLESNWLTSSSDAKTGLKGGSSFLEITSAHLMCLKKGWVLIGSASAAPLPRRWEICRFKSFLQFFQIKNFTMSEIPYLMRSLASGVRYGGRFSFPFNIFSIVFFLKKNRGW